MCLSAFLAYAVFHLSNGAHLFFINLQGQSTFLQDLDFIIKGVISGSARESRIHHWVSNLFSGENVSAGRFYSVAGHPGIGILVSNWSDGNFDPIPSGFVGFRFNTGKGTQYGWARVEGRNINFHLHFLIKDYAWGDVGDAILTGQKLIRPISWFRFPRATGFWSCGTGRLAETAKQATE
jgi:hypothetical protein